MKDVARIGNINSYTEIHASKKNKAMINYKKKNSAYKLGEPNQSTRLNKEETIVTSHSNTSTESDVTQSCGINAYAHRGKKGVVNA